MSKKLKCQHGPTNTYTLTSPIGNLEVICCSRGLHFLKHVATFSEKTFKPDLGVEVKLIKQLYDDNGYTYKPVLLAKDWLQQYFTCGKSGIISPEPFLCYLAHSGLFFHKVWKTLKDDVNFGKTISYGELAEICGSPNAQQAVGQAMKKNPFSLIVPCHRVILSSGKPGNYSGGQKNLMKCWLLKHESFPEQC